jgi:hypothetical protein
MSCAINLKLSLVIAGMLDFLQISEMLLTPAWTLTSK